ncbi:MAG: tetraacyldisaccharide 4'-kinase [Candidatus Gastranaerophilales bacterium]|nr:tetraacyldisaccharide 4'-kinase [Candidatus Gastranaerophilales bacterium]
MNFKTRMSALHYDKNAKGLFVDMLEFLSIFYGIISRMRNILYDRGVLKSVRTGAKVISVGNITTGGSGKTPVVAELVKYFINKDEKVAVITRGYGGKLSNRCVNLISDGVNIYYDAISAGDEAYWHAVNNPMCSVLTCKNRVKAAEYAVGTLGCSVIILDDAFQHRHIYRDLDIVLVDSELGLGNEKLLPAGPLREGREAFDRVDRLVIVNKGSDEKRAEKFAKVTGKKLGCRSCVCSTKPDYIYNIKSGEKIAAGEAVTAVCAIGSPEPFFRFVENEFEVIEKIAYDDHHIYKQSEIDSIKGTIITTEKDAVKMSGFSRKDIYAMKLKVDIDISALLSD